MIHLPIDLRRLKRLVIVHEFANLMTNRFNCSDMKKNLLCERECTCLECPDFPFSLTTRSTGESFKCECPGT